MKDGQQGEEHEKKATFEEEEKQVKVICSGLTGFG